MFNQEQKEALIHYGKKLVHDGLTKGTGGNLSIFDRKSQTLLITPSGIDFFAIGMDDLVVVDLEGKRMEGKQKPSSEWQMHSLLYKQYPDSCAVIHGHTIFSTLFACMRKPIKSIHYMIAVSGPEVPVATYARYGTKELAKHAVEAMGLGKAVLLANHGILTRGTSLADAFDVALQIEYVAELYYRSLSLGGAHLLDEQEMQGICQQFDTYSAYQKEK